MKGTASRLDAVTRTVKKLAAGAGQTVMTATSGYRLVVLAITATITQALTNGTITFKDQDGTVLFAVNTSSATTNKRLSLPFNPLGWMTAQTLKADLDANAGVALLITSQEVPL